MTKTTQDESPEQDESRLLKAIQTVAIHPKDAKALVAQYTTQARRSNPSADSNRIQELVADKIIAKYSVLAAASGGATALSSVIPGIGTAVAMVGGGLADTLISMKFQVDMTMCLAQTFGWDLGTEDGRHLAFLIAAGGTLEKAGVEAAHRIASKAGVTMLRQYLKGATLQAIKELFKRIGIIFSRKAIEKALPFGIGVIIGSSANYALTRYVGGTAKRWFVIDRDEAPEPTRATDVPLGRKVCRACGGVSFEQLQNCPSCSKPQWWR